jgi:O-acetylserine/cysteine efflux transporter
VLFLPALQEHAGCVHPRHVAAALLVVLVWGVNFVVIDVGLRSTPPLLLAALRFALVAAVCAPFVARPTLRAPQLVALGLTLYVGQFALLFTAMDAGLSAGLAAVVLQSQAVFTLALAALVLGERPRPVASAGLVAAVAGLVLVGLGRGGSTPQGYLLGLAGGLSWACGNLVARRSGATGQGLSLVVWGSVVAAPVLAVLAVVEVGPAGLPDAVAGIGPAGALSLAYLTVLATVFGFGTWSALVSRYPAPVVAPFTMLVPPVGLVAAWVFLGDRPTPLALVGSALVVGGLVVPALATRRAARASLDGYNDPEEDRAGSPDGSADVGAPGRDRAAVAPPVEPAAGTS